MLAIVEHQGKFYLIHERTGKTWRTCFTHIRTAENCRDKVHQTWARDPNLEEYELNHGPSFIKDDEVCIVSEYLSRAYA